MRFGSGRTGLLQDSTTGSIIVQDGHQDDSIQMQSLSEGNDINIVTHNKVIHIRLINIS